ncbi:MAG: hypothetical protein MMC23_003207 [Stictis urceolatum]|nr:hypothetical protein [Stictis urceolata]
MDSIQVAFDSDSLKHFHHASLSADSQQIDTVRFDLSLYSSVYAESIQSYGMQCSGFMWGNAELQQFFDSSNDPNISRAWQWGKEWGHDFSWPADGQLPPSLSFLEKMHKQYKLCYEAQEKLMKGDECIATIAQGLKRIIPSRIEISDKPMSEKDQVDDEALHFNGRLKTPLSHTPAQTMRKTLDVVFELLQDVQPQELSFNILAPMKDPAGLDLSTFEAVHKSLGKCERMTVTIEKIAARWHREGTKREKIKPVFAFVHSLLEVPHLMHIDLNLGEYCANWDMPESSLRDWIPDAPWKLESLRLKGVPFTFEELRSFERYQIHELTLDTCFLTTETWVDALETLRSLKLEQFTLEKPGGGGFRHPKWNVPGTSTDGWVDYVLGKQDTKPSL